MYVTSVSAHWVPFRWGLLLAISSLCKYLWVSVELSLCFIQTHQTLSLSLQEFFRLWFCFGFCLSSFLCTLKTLIALWKLALCSGSSSPGDFSGLHTKQLALMLPNLQPCKTGINTSESLSKNCFPWTLLLWITVFYLVNVTIFLVPKSAALQ